MSGRPWHDRDLVLDTNVLIHLGRFDVTGRWLYDTFLRGGRPMAPLVSVVSLAEAHSFSAQNAWPQDKSERLRAMLKLCVVRDITQDDASLMEAYRTLDVASHKKGITMGKNDLWIAAETRRMGAVLLTRDKDFDHLAELQEMALDRFELVSRAG